MYKIQMILFSFLLVFIIACGNSTESTDKQAVNSIEIEAVSDQELISDANTNQPEPVQANEEKINQQENIGTVEESKDKVETSSTEKKLNESPKATPVAEKVIAKAKEKVASTKVEAPKKEVIEKTKTVVSTPSPTPPSTKEAKAPSIEKPKVEAPAPATTVEKKKEEVKEVVPVKPALSHDGWNALLGKYVSGSGKVNYAGFKSDQSKLDAYLKLLADNPVQSNWSRNKKLAYWINAYNAFTVKLIVDNYPVSSITKLHGGKPWDAKWIKLGSKTYSLNNIENDIIRPQFKEPRIHFAVNCAAKSCPPIINKAWTASNLNSLFEQQTKKFINNPAFNKIEGKKIQVSKIFEWYGEDFGNLIDYLNKYSTTPIKSNAKVEFLEYDWALNK